MKTNKWSKIIKAKNLWNQSKWNWSKTENAVKLSFKLAKNQISVYNRGPIVERYLKTRNRPLSNVERHSTRLNQWNKWKPRPNDHSKQTLILIDVDCALILSHETHVCHVTTPPLPWTLADKHFWGEKVVWQGSVYLRDHSLTRVMAIITCILINNKAILVH